MLTTLSAIQLKKESCLYTWPAHDWRTVRFRVRDRDRV